MQKIWNIKKIDEVVTDIEIYDVISSQKSYDWWTDEEGTEVTPSAFKDELNSVETPEICVRINSAGGEVFAAEAIATAISEIRSKGKKVTCKIDGYCASAAVRIALACENIAIPASGYMMIHDPAQFLYGYYGLGDLNTLTNTLSVIKDGIINAYNAKTGMGKDELSDLMTAETWLTGEQAVEKGFADEILYSDVSVSNIANHKGLLLNGALLNPAAYKQPPKALVDALKSTKIDNTGGNEEMEIKNIDELKAAFPEFCAEIANTATAAGKDAGIAQERTRIQAIDAMQGKIKNEVLNKAKYETFENAEKVALDAVTAGEFVNTSVLSAIAADAQATANVAATANIGTDAPVDEAAQAKEMAMNVAKKVWNK